MRRKASLLFLWAITCSALAEGTVFVEGTFRFEDRVYSKDQWDGVIITAVRHSTVAVQDGEGNELVSTSTDADGYFGVSVDALSEGDAFRVKIFSDSNAAVVGGYELHVWSCVAAYESTASIPISPVIPRLGVCSETNRALNIMDAIIDGSQYAESLSGTQPSRVRVVYPGAFAGHAPAYHAIFNFIYIDEQEDAENDDVVLHEYGHFLLDFYTSFLGVLQPTGDHSTCELASSPELALSEGWASYLAAAIQDRAWWARQPGQYVDLETGQASGCPTGPYKPDSTDYEGSVAAVLWDTRDGAEDAFDTINGDEVQTWNIVDERWDLKLNFPTVVDFRDEWETAMEIDPIVCAYTGEFCLPSNDPPNTPSTPYPSSGENGVSVSPLLSWSGGDPDSDDVTYDVYLEADSESPGTLQCQNLSVETCNPGILPFGTSYFWRVFSNDIHGATTQSPIWEFSTEPVPDTADLAVTLTALTEPVGLGGNISWLVNATNNGPATANNVALTDTLPDSVIFVSTNRPELCSETDNSVTCETEVLGAGENFPPITIIAQATEAGTANNQAVIVAAESDPNADNNSAMDSVMVNGPCVQSEAKLTANDPTEDAKLGTAIAISGGTMVAGALAADGVVASSGGAYVFLRDGPNWIQEQKLVANDGALGDLFGWAVAIRQNTIAVGAVLDSHGPIRHGSAYVFERNGQSWVQHQKLIASDAALGDLFGASVAIGDATIVVSATGDDNTAGAAYIFLWNGIEWIEESKLVASDRSDLDVFGHSVAMSGNTIVIGAPRDDDLANDSGAAYVFTGAADSWSQQQKLKASDGAEFDMFGTSVAIDGDTIVVGAWEDDNPESNSGSVYVFQRTGTTWTEQQKLAPSDGAESDLFGDPVSISGDTVVVGAREDDDAGPEAGSIYFFQRNGSSWIEKKKIFACDSGPGDRFGTAVVDGGHILVGARGHDGFYSDSGAVYIYDVSEALAASVTVMMTEPSQPAVYTPGANITMEWTSTGAEISDLVILSMKRDIVPPSTTYPDGTNWFRFSETADNDGIENISIPMSVAQADDWRFYVRHSESGAFDGLDLNFSVCADSDGDGVCNSGDLCLGDDATGDSDADSICNDLDGCPGFDDLIDTDGDTVPDDCDLCPGFNDFVDTDSDGIPNGCDTCEGDDASGDTDEDGICDDLDVCLGDDAIGDSDNDGICDDVDICPGFDDLVDSDSDGAPDGCDACEGFDDSLDGDGDGVPDDCDLCQGDDTTGDSDDDGVCDDLDICQGDDSTGDTDGDEVCADLDCDDSDPDSSEIDHCGVCGGNNETCAEIFENGFESGDTSAWN